MIHLDFFFCAHVLEQENLKDSIWHFLYFRNLGRRLLHKEGDSYLVAKRMINGSNR